MELNHLYNIVISEPIYLSIAILLLLATIYSILKKFFNLLIIILIGLIFYLAYLIYTNQDLPGEADEIIYPAIDTIKEKTEEFIDDLSKD